MQQPGRPREFDPDEVLSQIMQLFWEHGYEATGLSDIIAVTGMGKASLYAAFGNKKSLYLKALAHYEKLIVDAAVSILRSREMKPLERIDAFLSSAVTAVRDHKDRRGCFLCNASADRAALDPDTANQVRRGYDKMRMAIADSLREAHPAQSEETIIAHAQLVLTVYSGLRIMSRAGTESEDMARTKESFMATLARPDT